MLSGMPVEMLSRMLSRMLDEISCRIPSRMPSEMLNECSMKYLMKCLMKCSVKWTLQPHERTQALYQRFGISGGHPPEPPGPSERKLYVRGQMLIILSEHASIYNVPRVCLPSTFFWALT